jgi:orotidine-5'-phosphate decarboxylase
VTARTPFISQLESRWDRHETLLCVGLDPDSCRIPHRYRNGRGLLEFCTDIVDATASLVCAFKPQFAYFAAEAKEDDLAGLISYIHARYPGIPVILDAKRGDIGSTAERYATEAFQRYDADAVTVNPYPGPESVTPYLAYRDRGTIVLCRTSNPDSSWLQNSSAENPVYLRVAKAAVSWNVHRNVLLVAGATQVEELKRIRQVIGDMPLLVPGIGAQGGDLEAVVRHGADSRGAGLIINAARSILYADSEDPAAGASAAAADLLAQIRNLQAKYRLAG